MKSEYIEPTIKVDDILNIFIQTIDPQATISINAANVPLSTSGSVSTPALNTVTPTGYLVNKEGFIELPVLGKLNVLGYTTSQLRDSITKIAAAKYFKDPTVIVRFANFRVNVTGEVLKPGQYVMPNEKVSIIDALAMAGDLTIYGKRENVLLIRENADGTKTPYRVNLTRSDIMSAPYYYLKQNDVIYVEPRKAKSDANDASQARYVTIAASLLSILIILATRLK
ncbi:polysaccharide biosynthesis/export family protein [Mucilaginibacter rubeus]|uniref:polysaccharide biosynthesis/export family protein n=1 Tax=Mucilaginibacter rubeus TaxID=2027860 RepID=UPI001CC1CC11|nr:polysaccharide biosynthesis/export family protein [Mucilaginibacter rubeus]